LKAKKLEGLKASQDNTGSKVAPSAAVARVIATTDARPQETLMQFEYFRTGCRGHVKTAEYSHKSVPPGGTDLTAPHVANACAPE
jgi:hypothetical protein